MKQALIATALTTIAMAALLLGRSTTWQRRTVTIHIHSTYFVLPHWLLAIFIIALLALAFGATAACCNAFTKPLYNLIAVAGLTGVLGLYLYIRGIFDR